MDSPPPSDLSSIRPRAIASMSSSTNSSDSTKASSGLQSRLGPNSFLRRSSNPYLPTSTELAITAIFPAILIFGTIFSFISPETRASPFDYSAKAHVQNHLAPSYFARKNNLLNIVFVKRAWGWISLAFFAFLTTKAEFADQRRKWTAVARWAAVTTWWMAVTQWCFGPPVIDRCFRWSGGKCESAEAALQNTDGGMAGRMIQEGAVKDMLTAAACRAAGGRWRGGHDTSGHVFLLVLGSFFLVQEVGWVATRWIRDERIVVMADGAVKRASAEGYGTAEIEREYMLGFGGRVAAGVVALSWFMMLMTAMYFHTWFEKLTGLLIALMAVYSVYILPRWMPGLRAVLGLPGI